MSENAEDTMKSSALVPRLCHIVKLDDFDGYGFNLHAEKNKIGQYVGKVDEGSPAQAAGLKEGDRIIEVNGVNISGENHKQVVQRIKSVLDETKLLVVDLQTDAHYKGKGVAVSGDLPEVVCVKTPHDGKQHNDASGSDSDGLPSYKSENPSSYNGSEENAAISNENTSFENTPSSDRKMKDIIESEQEDNKSIASNGTFEKKLNLNMTAKELRAQLASKKKYDPKKEALDFRKKYEIIQKL